MIAIGLLASGPVFAQDVYRWTDENGTVHFTDRPPANQAAEQVDMTYQRTDRDAMRDRLAARAQLRDAATLREGQTSEAAEEAQAQRDAILEQRSANCQTARERLNRYQTARRLYRPGAEGEREYLSDEELDTARADAVNLVQQWCDE